MLLLSRLNVCLFLLLSVATSWAADYSHPEIERLLLADEAPSGVVIEVASRDPDTWQWATEMIRQFRQQLDQRFPGIEIAVVSHGSEQFLLTSDNLARSPDTRDAIGRLTEQGVDFHVCGTHSGWRGVAESEYSELVNVAPSGPAQITDYRNLGYQLVVLRRPG